MGKITKKKIYAIAGLLAFLLAGEIPNAATLIGGVFIMTGLALFNIRKTDFRK